MDWSSQVNCGQGRAGQVWSKSGQGWSGRSSGESLVWTALTSLDFLVNSGVVPTDLFNVVYWSSQVRFGLVWFHVVRGVWGCDRASGRDLFPPVLRPAPTRTQARDSR